MIKPNTLLAAASLLIASVAAQNDCAVANTLWRNMGKTTTISSSTSTSCCGTNGISCLNGRITELEWSRRSLSGSIHSDIGKLTALKWLWLWTNTITGTIPSTIVNCKQLLVISLSDNRLSGSVPGYINQLPNLQSIYLWGNQLTGDFPTAWLNMTNLKELVLYSNQLKGSLPTNIGNLVNLQKLTLQFNQFSGTIPISLYNMVYLTDLRLTGNAFTGGISTDISKLIRMQFLYMNENQLTGSIPAGVCSMPNLEELSLSINSLSGTIPTCVGTLKKVKHFYIRNNQLTGSLPTEIGAMTALFHFTASSNQLTGNIPDTFGNLANLKYVYLGNNQLTGIPQGLLNLPTIERLLFPNPMSTAPYDAIKPMTIGAMTSTALTNFLNTAPKLVKREHLSEKFSNLFKRQMTSTATADELYAMCPLNNVRDANVPAGCLAGIYNKFCKSITTIAQLQECQNRYDAVFTVSIFKTLGDACPAWKTGPKSAACGTAITNFYKIVTYGSESVTLTKANAQDLVNTIFNSPTYAPCPTGQTIVKCTWT